MIVTMGRAKEVARNAGITVEGLGGTCGGVIGAVAGIGLASMGNDGRFLMKGRARDLKHSVRTLPEVLASGIDQVVTLDGRLVSGGKIDLSRSANPSFVQGKAVLFVEERDGCLVALKEEIRRVKILPVATSTADEKEAPLLPSAGRGPHQVPA
jgi:hypothetical protein